MPKLETRTLTEQIAAHLREDVLAGRLAGGQRLSQESLAEQFNVSRIPVRDALRLLEAEGLVLSDRRTGTTVSDLSADDLEELYEMRMALEPVIARIATAKMRPVDIAEMGRQLEIMRASDATSDASRGSWYVAHAAFHQALNLRAGRPRMCALVESLRAQTERYVRLYKLLHAHADQLVGDHEAIYEAVGRRDTDAAASLVREHMERVRDQVLAYLESHGR